MYSYKGRKKTIEQFEDTLLQSDNNYTGNYGDCKTSNNKTPAYINLSNSNINTCSTVCNNDTNCSGFSFDYSSNKCSIYTPSIGGTIDPTNGSTDNAPVYKAISSATATTNTVCFIKNNVAPGYNKFAGHCVDTNGKWPKRNVASANFNECYNYCSSDANCQGFSYSQGGTCITFGATWAQSSYNNVSGGWYQIDNEVDAGKEYSTSYQNLGTANSKITKGDNTNFKGLTCYIKKTGTDSPQVSPVVSNYYSLAGACRSINNKYPIWTSARYIGDESICKATCNIDALCSGYAFNSSAADQKCQLFGYTFSNKKGNIDPNTSAIPINYSPYRYYPVYTTDNSSNWICNIKQRVTPTNYIRNSKKGVCKSINNKYVPYSVGKTTYNNCVNLCEKDYKCSGYSYSNLGDCYIHDPTAPANNSPDINTISLDISGIPLTTADGNILTDCYIKRVTKCINIVSLNSDFQSPLLPTNTGQLIYTDYTINNWTGGITNPAAAIGTPRTGLIYNYQLSKQYAFLDANTYIEQTFPNKQFQNGKYVFNVSIIMNTTIVPITTISIISIDASNNEITEVSVSSNTTTPTINGIHNLEVMIVGDETASWYGKQMKIKIINNDSSRILYTKAEFKLYRDCPMNVPPTTTTTTTPTTTTTTTAATTTMPTTAPTTTAAPTTTTAPTTTAPTTTAAPTTVATTVATTAAIIPVNDSYYAPAEANSSYYAPTTTTRLVSPVNVNNPIFIRTKSRNILQIDVANEYQNSIDNIVNNIKKVLDPDNNKYTFDVSYFGDNININVYKKTSTFNNSETFENASNSTIYVVFNDNIQNTDPYIMSKLTRVNKNELLTAQTQTATSTSSNKTGIIIGIFVGIIVLLLIGVFVYFKFFRNKKHSANEDESNTTKTTAVPDGPTADADAPDAPTDAAPDADAAANFKYYW
jgi:hypothetical protein